VKLAISALRAYFSAFHLEELSVSFPAKRKRVFDLYRLKPKTELISWFTYMDTWRRKNFFQGGWQ